MKKQDEAPFLSFPAPEIITSLLPVSFFKLDLATNIFTFDERFGPMIGLPPIAKISKDEFWSRSPWLDTDQIQMLILSIQEGNATQMKREFWMKDVAGSEKRFEWSAKLENSNTLVGCIREITIENTFLPNLNESQRWFMEVLDESPHALYRIDLKTGRFDYVSKGFSDAIGMTRDEVLSLSHQEFGSRMHPDDVKRILIERDEQLKDSKGGRFTMYVEFRYKMKNGNYVWLNDTFSIVPGPDGQFSYQVGFGAVIEDRKKIEEKLRIVNEELEERVVERTSKLTQANLRLSEVMKSRQELEKKLLEISERERRFVGRELHDGLCQQIVGVMCMFESVRHRLAKTSNIEESNILMMRNLLHDAVKQIRTLARGFCPLLLEPGSVGIALTTLVAQIGVLYNIECDFSGSSDLKVKDPDAALHLFRISQEAIQNGIRHGKATKISISLSSDTDNVTLCVENNGKPIETKEDKVSSKQEAKLDRGIGLKLIEYRVDLLGGKWKFENRKNDVGVRLTINVPINGRIIDEENNK